ncbi:GNAT family N-acetyltransferase [Microvirga sp. ACRRW]|uniref:GNAT family N-acetyltransferase n=1 Tax=Microvirga sp. ACRRW TaxID=2918205 RepID=UPI001EF55229|nr:GNAT family N-acetyltransferase [Microvirga sp. ACRRW]MCG7393497.1 GNAT family N-acetyltransferase [Microvirga sp. ACRRW]
MIVRPAEPDDIPFMAGIAQRSYALAFANILEAEVIDDHDIAFFMARFAFAWERMLVARSGETLTGFLLITDGHIDMLFMDPDASGQGGGARLLAEAEARGAKSLECFRDNHGARRFYERHGWRVTREYEREFAGCKRSFIFYEKSKVV